MRHPIPFLIAALGLVGCETDCSGEPGPGPGPSSHSPKLTGPNATPDEPARPPIGRLSPTAAEKFLWFAPPPLELGLKPRPPTGAPVACGMIQPKIALKAPMAIDSKVVDHRWGLAGGSGQFVVARPIRSARGGEVIQLTVLRQDASPVSFEVKAPIRGALRVLYRPRVLVMADGWLVASVQRLGKKRSAPPRVVVSRVNAAGRTIATETRTAVLPPVSPSLRLVSDGKGGAVVSWTARDADGWVAFGRLLDEKGMLKGPGVRLTDPQPEGTVGPLVNDLVRVTNGYALTWRTDSWEGDSTGVAVRYYNNDLHHLGEPQTYTQFGHSGLPAITAAWNGAALGVAWNDLGTNNEDRIRLWTVPPVDFPSLARRVPVDSPPSLFWTGRGYLVAGPRSATFVSPLGEVRVGPQAYPGEGGPRQIAWDGERFALLWTQRPKPGVVKTMLARGGLFCRGSDTPAP